MGLLDSVESNPIMMAPSVVIYGGPGIGKTTVAMDAPSVVFISTDLDSTKMKGGANRLPMARSRDDVFNQIQALIDDDHDYKTLAIDDCSGLATIFEASVCEKHHRENIGEVKGGWGKGERFTSNIFVDLLNKLDELRVKRKMVIILLAHSEIRSFANPEGEAYDRNQLELHKYYSELIIKWCDILAFARKKVMTSVKAEGTIHERNIGVTRDERVFAMEEKPAYKAKSRFNHKHEVPMTWEAIMEGITA